MLGHNVVPIVLSDDEEVLQSPGKPHFQEHVENQDRLVFKYDNFTLNFDCNIIC